MSKSLRTLYLDTMLWNELCDEGLKAEQLMSMLADRGAELVISTQLVYELAKTFQSNKENSQERGKALFRYLNQFVEKRIRCLKMNRDILIEEVRRANSALSTVVPYLRADDYERLRQEVKKLSRGVFDSKADQFISARKNIARSVRSNIVRSMEVLRFVKEVCGRLSFEEFLERFGGTHAADMVELHLLALIPSADRRKLRRVAKKLAASSKYRLSHALVRADLYLHWRSARGESLPRDAQDDCYHLVNSAYCDTYATKDQYQKTYAPHVLRETTVAIYDSSSSLSDWFCLLLGRTSVRR